MNPENTLEIWKPVVGFEEFYEVSNLGRVKSIIKRSYDLILSPSINKHGYRLVNLWGRGGKHGKRVRIYRLVCEAFHPNPENKPSVNHINGIKTDDRAENLEWNTYSENMAHAYRTGLFTHSRTGKHGYDNPQSKEVIQLDPVTKKEIARFGSATEAAKKAGVNQSTLSKGCVERRPLRNGLLFHYSTS